MEVSHWLGEVPDLRDKYALVYFWNSTSESCRQAIPALNDLGQKFATNMNFITLTTEAPDQNTWIAAMKDTLAKNPKYKDMHLVATVYGDDQPEKSTTEMEALLVPENLTQPVRLSAPVPNAAEPSGTKAA